jgi:hypothetical protein
LEKFKVQGSKFKEKAAPRNRWAMPTLHIFSSFMGGLQAQERRLMMAGPAASPTEGFISDKTE